MLVGDFERGEPLAGELRAGGLLVRSELELGRTGGEIAREGVGSGATILERSMRGRAGDELEATGGAGGDVVLARRWGAEDAESATRTSAFG